MFEEGVDGLLGGWIDGRAMILRRVVVEAC
jgi:hypothetical protein